MARRRGRSPAPQSITPVAVTADTITLSWQPGSANTASYVVWAKRISSNSRDYGSDYVQVQNSTGAACVDVALA